MKKKRIYVLLLCVLLLISSLPINFAIGLSTAIKEVDGEYNSSLLSSQFTEDSQYSIVEFPVTLFDYDAAGFNAAYKNKGDRFQFRGGSGDAAADGGTSGINESSSDFAKQGIMEQNLIDGLPKIKYGYDLGTVLFDNNSYGDYKTAYNDVKFQFVHNEETGYYEYKSAANHAQYNPDNNKVELFADSLAPVRNTVLSLTPTAYVSPSDVSFTTSGNIITGTATDLNNNDRIDAYFHYNSLKTETQIIDTAKVDKIYVRAYLPGTIGNNIFKVYYTTDITGQTGYQEEQHFYVEYSQTQDGWVEFVFDTTQTVTTSKGTFNRWDGNITGIRLDPFDSNYGTSTINADGSYQFKIFDIVLINSDSGESLSYYGGFYPFSDIKESTVGSAGTFDYNKWTEIQEDDALYYNASRAIFENGASGLDFLHFGMVMEFDFYMPVSGTSTGLANDTTTTSDNLRFEFTGDDDMWVFVDGKLVLDVGGGHGALNTYMDLTDREVYIEKAVNVTGYNSNSGSAASKTTPITDSSLFEPGLHKVKIFYMERCGSVSNCFIKFNLPQTPEGDILVSKSAVETNGNSNTIADESFEFVIKDGEEPMANQTYLLLGDGITDPNGEVKRTDSSGKFTLKNGQFASFVGIDEYKSITVTEIDKSIAGFTKESTTVNGEEGLSDTLVTLANSGINFSFVNTYTEQKAQINYIRVMPEDYILYEGYNDGGVNLGNVSSPADVNEQVSENIFVKTDTAEGSTAAVIGNIPKQLSFVGWYTDEECTNKISDDAFFEPSRNGNGLYESASYYAKFEYVYGDLTIDKNAIDVIRDIDFDETQTFLFRVEGVDYYGEDINLTVTLDMKNNLFANDGHNSVVIKDLPIGKYKVTELENWSWRYDVSELEVSDNAEGTNIKYSSVDDDNKFEKAEFYLAPTGTTVSYVNNRPNPYWLSGDFYVKNLFNHSSSRA